MIDPSHQLTLEYILLGLLLEKPSHGYALFDRLQAAPDLSLIWRLKRSKLYYLLDKLVEEGFLTGSVDSGNGYPDRKVFHITEKGKDAFNVWIEEPVQNSRHVRIAFLSKLYFAERQGKEVALDLIDSQLSVCRHWIKNLQQELDDSPEKTFITTQVYQFRIGQVDAMLSWLESCRESLLEGNQ
jgi:DNA-binding PadR family transcriptional regulator